MPKLVCRCGYVHDLSPIPDDGWVVVRDRDYEELIGAEIEMAVDTDDSALRTVNRLTSRLYECPRCGALMWMGDGEKGVRIFVPLGTRAPIT